MSYLKLTIQFRNKTISTMSRFNQAKKNTRKKQNLNFFYKQKQTLKISFSIKRNAILKRNVASLMSQDKFNFVEVLHNKQKPKNQISLIFGYHGIIAFIGVSLFVL